MTLEELFTEEYKNLKDKNELLNEQIKSSRRVSKDMFDKYREICDFLYSLKLQIKKSNLEDVKYIAIGQTIICEGEKFFELASKFTKDETKKEDEK